MSNTTSAPLQQIRIQLVEPNGGRREFRLVNGGTLMVGSGANCGVRLMDSSVSAIHCLIRLREGEIEVQDWCTKLGTFVNGERIEEEARLQLGSEIRIGGFTLVTNADARSHAEPTSGKPAVNPGCGSGCRTPLPDVAVPAASVAVIPTASPSLPADDSDSAAETELTSIADPLHQTRVAPETVTETMAARPAVKPASAPEQREPRPAPNEEAFDAETMKLLRAEIECLQTELAERDRQLAEFAQYIDGDLPAPCEVTDSAEVEKLVARLESLLAELERNDQRTHALEELLRAEQQLVRHQEEERQQMESWVGEIEQRITAREREWTAEREVLSQRVENLRQERDEADRCLHNSGGGVDTAVQEAIVAGLRSEMDQLKGELERSRQATQAALSDVSSLKNRSPELFAREQIEEAIRAERLALAQERAALSRERVELARGTANAESASQERRMNAADERFIAFRQTLKEIHKEELSQEHQPRKPSLGARIADLWRRLEGPSDTD